MDMFSFKKRILWGLAFLIAWMVLIPLAMYFFGPGGSANFLINMRVLITWLDLVIFVTSVLLMAVGSLMTIAGVLLIIANFLTFRTTGWPISKSIRQLVGTLLQWSIPTGFATLIFYAIFVW